jgi:Tol biopolymer transport system component
MLQRSRGALSRAVLAAGALSLVLAAGARAQSPVVVSVDTTGGPANGDSYGVRVSATGRYVAFSSIADDLVDQTRSSDVDVFVRDLVTGVTELITAAPDGGPANGYSEAWSISADGRWVVFHTDATNLVPGGMKGLYVRDRATGVTTEETLAPGGGGVGNGTETGSISDDGRWLVISSQSSALVAGDTNAAYDVFVRDRQLGVTKRVSVGPDGVEGNSESFAVEGSISADGRWIVFQSLATNLVPGFVPQVGPNVFPARPDHGRHDGPERERARGAGERWRVQPYDLRRRARRGLLVGSLQPGAVRPA